MHSIKLCETVVFLIHKRFTNYIFLVVCFRAPSVIKIRDYFMCKVEERQARV